MAGGKDQAHSECIPAPSDDYELSYRTDLANAVGLIVATPLHYIGQDKEVIWGMPDGAMSFSDDVWVEFRQVMESIFNNAVERHLPEGVEPVRRALSHRYDRPPAAQSWPELAMWIWDNALQVLGAFDILVSTGRILIETKRGVNEWFQKKSVEVTEGVVSQEQREIHERGFTLEPRISFTQADVAALAAMDAHDRYGVTTGVQINVFPRSIPGFGGPSFPGAPTTYLVRLVDGPRVLVYQINSEGIVAEHFLLSGDRITPLQIPNEFGFQTHFQIIETYPGINIKPSRQQ